MLLHRAYQPAIAIPALHSLTEAQAACIAAALSPLPPFWSLERHQSCDGHLSLLLGAGDDVTLVVDRDIDGIQISRMQGDDLYPGERYDRVEDVIAALRNLYR